MSLAEELPRRLASMDSRINQVQHQLGVINDLTRRQVDIAERLADSIIRLAHAVEQNGQALALLAETMRARKED